MRPRRPRGVGWPWMVASMVTASSRRLSVLSTPPVPSSITGGGGVASGKPDVPAPKPTPVRSFCAALRASWVRSQVSSILVSLSEPPLGGAGGLPVSAMPADSARAHRPGAIHIERCARSAAASVRGGGPRSAWVAWIRCGKGSHCAAPPASGCSGWPRGPRRLLRRPAACQRLQLERAQPLPGPRGSGGDGGGGGGEPSDAGPDVDPTLGGPCTDDAQCDDGADCTSDACDQTLLLCRFTPDDAPCQNDVYCDGSRCASPRPAARPADPCPAATRPRAPSTPARRPPRPASTPLATWTGRRRG